MGYLDGARESRDMSLDVMTEGISVQGMRDFTDFINAKLLKGVSSKLEETKGIVTALNSGWQGESRDVFINNFEKGIKQVQKDLNTEYKDLMKRLGELMDDYFNQDKKMINML